MPDLFYEFIKKRRSTRSFTDQPIEEEKIEILMKAALLAPSSRNRTPWHFILVQDREMIKKLSNANPCDGQFLVSATLIVIVAGDAMQSEIWIEDCSVASAFILLEAESVGLGSCWVQVENRMADKEQTTEDYIRQLLCIPDNIKITNMIALGYRNEAEDENSQSPEQILLEQIRKMSLQERIHRERF